jgi:hypothetical protein
MVPFSYKMTRAPTGAEKQVIARYLNNNLYGITGEINGDSLILMTDGTKPIIPPMFEQGDNHKHSSLLDILPPGFAQIPYAITDLSRMVPGLFDVIPSSPYEFGEAELGGAALKKGNGLETQIS